MFKRLRVFPRERRAGKSSDPLFVALSLLPCLPPKLTASPLLAPPSRQIPGEEGMGLSDFEAAAVKLSSRDGGGAEAAATIGARGGRRCGSVGVFLLDSRTLKWVAFALVVGWLLCPCCSLNSEVSLPRLFVASECQAKTIKKTSSPTYCFSHYDT